MKVFNDPNPGDVAPLCATGVVATIGFFDGAHKGHQAVFDLVREKAEEAARCSAVITFDPHPAKVLRPENAPKLLTAHEHKLELFAEVGFDLAVVYSFNTELASYSPSQFVERLLVEGLDVKEIIVGEDFHFGDKRSGNVDTLKDLGADHGFSVSGIELLAQANSGALSVSSTSIRNALVGGDIEKANRLLGRAHEVRGEVVHGDKRGTSIGFPTANLSLDTDIALPADSVYAGWVCLGDGSVYPAAINVGKRPTFHQNVSESSVEAHLIGFDGDLYGQKIAVKFEHLLRSEKRFSGVDELKEQLNVDIAAATQLLG